MKHVTIYTDGACRGNPGPGGWAAILSYGERVKVVTGRDQDTTNNRMELVAVFQGLAALKEPCSVTVCTDSQNVIGWLSEGWRRKNPEIARLCHTIDLLVAACGHRVRYEWVKGHSGHPLNERADQLAVAAMAVLGNP